MKLDIKKSLNDIPLYMEINHDKKSKTIMIYINIPDKYNSPLITAIKEKQRGLYGNYPHGCHTNKKCLACCKISLHTSTSKTIKKLTNNIFENSNFVYIELLYNNTLLFPDIATNEEKTVLKGIGKLMFCTGIGYAIEENLIKKSHFDKTYVILQAGSDGCNIDDKYNNYSENELVIELYKNYPYDLYRFLHDCHLIGKCYDQVKELKDTLCSIKANENLISYYKKEYNLEILHPGQGLLTVMIADINNVINKCKNIIDDYTEHNFQVNIVNVTEQLTINEPIEPITTTSRYNLRNRNLGT